MVSGSGIIVPGTRLIIDSRKSQDPGVLLALFGMITMLVLTFIPNRKLNQLAIPIALAVTGRGGVGLIVNYGFFNEC